MSVFNRGFCTRIGGTCPGGDKPSCCTFHMTKRIEGLGRQFVESKPAMTPADRALVLVQRMIDSNEITIPRDYKEALAILGEADKATKIGKAREIFAKYASLTSADRHNISAGFCDDRPMMLAILEAMEVRP